jgi:hypothetical protein
MSLIPSDPRFPALRVLACGLATVAAVGLAACGGTNGGNASGGATSAGGSSPAASASVVAGGTLSCLSATWRSLNINLPGVKGSGGAGAVLTVTPRGDLTLNTNSMQPFTGKISGVTQTIKFTGTETGVIQVNGSKLSGSYKAGSLTAAATVNGTKVKLPLSRFSHTSTLSWESFSCTSSTLQLIAPKQASIWTFTRNA